MLSLADLFLSGILLVNGAAVLNEDRFLVKIGWGYEQSRGESQSVKKQIINLLQAIRLIFTLPLMALNVVVIVLKLLLG
jgi:immediate early response 3-interacting protein 1